MKILIFLGLIVSPILFFYGEVRADEMSVINVRRNIQMSETDPVYKDFYIDGGDESGLKKNMVVQAVRKINIRDATGAHAYGEIKIPVGQLKIIAVYPKMAVAREYKLLSRDDLPMLEQVGIMTGDAVETKGSFIDRRPNSVAAPAPTTPAPAVAPTTPVEPAITTAPAALPAATAAATPPAVAPAPLQPVTVPTTKPESTPSQSQTEAPTKLN